MDFLTTATNIALIVFGFGALIFVHEMGHFLAAKWAGIRTEAFAIGMGHSVLSWRKGIGLVVGSTQAKVVARTGKAPAELSDTELAKHGLGETEYSLRWLPLGGVVKMLGQEDANPNAVSDDPRSYNVCPIGKRMIVVSAGVVMNLLLAVVLFIGAFMVGVKFEAPVIGDVALDLPAGTTAPDRAEERSIKEIGLLPGDTVLTIDGKPARTFADIFIASSMAKPGDQLRLTVAREGYEQPLHFTFVPEKDAASGLLSIGVTPGVSTTLMGLQRDGLLTRVLQSTGLAAMGVQPGMRLETINGTDVTSFGELARAASASNGQPLDTLWRAVDSDGRPQGGPVDATLAILPVYTQYQQRESNADFGLLGFSPLVRISYVDEKSRNFGKLLPDDVILRVGDLEYPRRSQIAPEIQRNKGHSLTVVVRRGDEEITVQCEVSRKGRLGIGLSDASELLVTAKPITTFARNNLEDPTVIDDLSTPIATFPPLGGTEIIAVDGAAVSSWRQFRAALRQSTAQAFENETNATVHLTIVHPTKEHPHEDFAVSLSVDEVAELHALSWTTQLASFYFEPVYTTLTADGNPVLAVTMGFKETYKFMVNVYLMIDRLFRGSIGVEQLRGPVGIVHIGVQVAERGIMYLVFFLAVISANLAVINFLPLPIVDGGLFLFLIYEKLKGRPPSIAFQNVATIVGLVLIGTIFLVVTWNDVTRLLS